MWACQTCTLLNTGEALACNVCGTPKTDDCVFIPEETSETPPSSRPQPQPQLQPQPDEVMHVGGVQQVEVQLSEEHEPAVQSSEPVRATELIQDVTDSTDLQTGTKSEHMDIGDDQSEFVNMSDEYELDDDEDDGYGWDDASDGDLDADEDADFVEYANDEFSKYHELRMRWSAKEEEIRAKSKRSLFDQEEYKNSKQIFTTRAVSQMLMNSLENMMKNSENSGIKVEAVDGSIFHWRIQISEFPERSQIYDDLIMLESLYDYHSIELDVKFDPDIYPFYPPDVRPVRPRLEDMFMLRIVCMDELMLSLWDPVTDLEALFSKIKRLIAAHGHADVENKVNDPSLNYELFTESEYQLCKLSMLTEISPRVNILYGDVKDVFHAHIKKLGNTSTKKTTKGVDKTVDEYVSHLATQRKKESEIQQILGVTLSDLSKHEISPVTVEMFESSCLIPFIERQLENTSVIAMERNSTMMTAVQSICRAMAQHQKLLYLFEKFPEQKRGLKTLIATAGKLVRADKSESSKVLPLIETTSSDVHQALQISKRRHKKHKPERSHRQHGKPKVRATVESKTVECDGKQQPEPLALEPHHTLEEAKSHSSSKLLNRFKNAIGMKVEHECPLCFLNFGQDVIELHVQTCNGLDGEVQCSFCSEMVSSIEFSEHFVKCEQIKEDEKLARTFDQEDPPPQHHGSLGQKPLNAQKGTCPLCLKPQKDASMKQHLKFCWKCAICSRSVNRFEMPAHVERCILRGRIDEEEKETIGLIRQEQGVLSEMQLAAVTDCQRRSRLESEKHYDEVQKKFQKLDFTEDDLKRVLRYIRNDAPIIIHVHLQLYLDKLTNDTYYRNQFETNTSSGSLSTSSRTQWEDRMYNKIYSKASGFDRVKYGVCNLFKSPGGVQAAYAYGDSYLLLQDVRLRCTFANMDTGNAASKLSTCEHYCHILASFTDAEVRDIYKVAVGERLSVESTSTQNYKEVQIHGPVQLNRDVKAVVVNSKYRNDKKICDQLEKFSKKNHCDIIWMS